jgi:hypothetical protein
MGTVGAPRDMTAKRRCTTTLDGAHDFELIQVDVSRVCRTPDCTMGAENIRDLH